MVLGMTLLYININPTIIIWTKRDQFPQNIPGIKGIEPPNSAFHWVFLVAESSPWWLVYLALLRDGLFLYIIIIIYHPESMSADWTPHNAMEFLQNPEYSHSHPSLADSSLAYCKATLWYAWIYWISWTIPISMAWIFGGNRLATEVWRFVWSPQAAGLPNSKMRQEPGRKNVGSWILKI